jgi:signal transduction histidine kinase/CheY-like chemotaxis protein
VAVPSDHDIILSLGEDLPVGIWVARAPSGELIYANRTFAEIVGARARPDVRVGGFAEPYGIYKRDGGLYPEDRMPFVRALTEKRVVVVDDITIRRADGTSVEVRAVARPVGSPISHVIVAFSDVSREAAAERARAESEQRLRRAQRLEAIGTLAGGIAHDFNNLIFGIKLIAAEVLAHADDAAKVRESMELIDDITDRSATLTRSLLGFARRGKHRAMPVSVNDVVTSMTELLTRTLAGVELSFELEAAERGLVVGDQAQLEQVVMNLVLNARDAVQAAGRVVVRTSDLSSSDPEAARFVVLEVSDDGPGIAPEIRDRVFEPYFTTRGATHGTGAGEPHAGLGLATVFGIVESHNGSIEVDAGLDGAGTTMRVVLPAASPPPVVRSRPTVADLPKGTGTLLVIDDDNMVRKVVSSSLTVLGYDTIEAASGSDAVEIYRARHAEIRAVVLDMVMPGMTGKATYLALREIDPSVIVLLMSGHTLNEAVQEILDLGVRSFVSKPYSIAVLAKAMAELMP